MNLTSLIFLSKKNAVIIFYIYSLWTAIALSLKDSEKSSVKSTTLYPTGFNSSAIYATSSKPKEVRKVKDKVPYIMYVA